MLRREESFIAPTPTTGPDYRHDSGVWRGSLTARFADVYGEEPSREDLDSAIQEANAYSADDLVNRLRLANRAWVRATLQDVPLSFSKDENGTSVQRVTQEQLSNKTERLAHVAGLLSLALRIRRDEDQHPSVFGAKRKKY